ncbi:IS110 family transposase, partial [Parafrankia sp. FMc2]|uniref:IS110 family transposase n=1 Tax=Parafrankia sp. FMc2 TaxID=3233196 RepID=UPI0034D61B87
MIREEISQPMSSMMLSRDDVIVGVDTHKDQHVAVLLDGLGGRLADLVLPATVAGFEMLLAFCLARVSGPGRLVAFGVEGTSSYGMGLARFLRRHGHEVREVSRPPRMGERRRVGKTDTIDAEHAAREIISGASTATPKTADGAVEALRLIKVARDTAVKAQSAAMITLKATLVTADDELRGVLEPLTDHRLIEACAALECVGAPTTPEKAMRHVLASLARRWLSLHKEVTSLSWHLKQQTKAAAPRLVEAVGIGPDTAAEMLLAAGDNTDRIRSESAFAKLCGVSPIPASSGRTHRHRLNRGGNRQANAALYRTVIVR